MKVHQPNSFFTKRAARSFACLMMLMAALSLTAHGQTNRSSLIVRVSDTSRAQVAGASVTIEPTSLSLTEQRRVAVTDADGNLTFDNLLVGAYRVTVESEGFAATKRDVALTAEANREIELVLRASDISESVVITASEDGYGALDANTATKTDLPLRDIPQAIQVVPQTVLRDQNANRLDELYKNVSGINAFSNYQDFAIRGFRSSEVLYNGVRANPYNFFATPKLNNIERVEVLKGPAAVLYGGGEPGGIINIVNKRPQAKAAREVAFTFGSFGQKQLAVDFTGALNDSQSLLYRLDAAFEDANSFRRFQEFRNTQIAPALTWRANSKTGITTRFEFIKDNRKGQRDRGLLAPFGDTNLLPLDFTVNEPTDRLGNTGYSAEVGFERIFNDNLRSNGLFRFSRSEYFNRYHEPRRVRLADGVLIADRQFRDQSNDVNFYAPTFNLIGDFQTGSITHNFLTGSDITIIDDGFTASFANAPFVTSLQVLNPVYGATNISAYPRDPELYFTDSRRYGFYVQDLIALHPKLKVLASARFSRFNDSTRFVYPADETANSSIQDTQSKVTFRTGAVYQPTSFVALYASYTQGFLPQLIDNQLPIFGGPFKPEESEQVETGAKFNFLNNRVNATLAAYRIVKRNTLVADPADEDFLRFIQLGRTRSKGFEVDITGSVTPRLSVITNYAFNRIAITEDSDPTLIGNPLPNAPRHSAGFWTRYDFERTPLGLAAGLSFIDRRETFDQRVQLPSYVVFDTAAFYRFRTFDFALNVDNLFDRRHFIGGYSTTSIFPGTPRRFKFTTRYRF
ncbi:MAG: TonB-dependent receptor [Pyrinomonadaceae bacterium MAG19_C2-C3]|nr:TonB-dependent receptor [Pyrinomonadaceae bacterium MAG19_C2-C3]